MINNTILMTAIYGFVLGFFNFIYMGFGHGIYVPVALFSSPLGFMGIAVAFWGTPILWTVIGFLISQHNKQYVVIGIVLLFIHYIVFFILSLYHKQWNDWYGFSNTILLNQLLPYLISGFIIYIAGQIYLWYLVINKFIQK